MTAAQSRRKSCRSSQPTKTCPLSVNNHLSVKGKHVVRRPHRLACRELGDVQGNVGMTFESSQSDSPCLVGTVKASDNTSVRQTTHLVVPSIRHVTPASVCAQHSYQSSRSTTHTQCHTPRLPHSCYAVMCKVATNASRRGRGMCAHRPLCKRQQQPPVNPSARSVTSATVTKPCSTGECRATVRPSSEAANRKDFCDCV